MLQVHNMMPHQHEEQIAKAHSHKHDHQDHDHKSDGDRSLPLDQADHSAEFGKTLIKPGNSKYNIELAKFMPLLRVGYSTQTTRLYHNIIQKIRPQHRDHLVPPAPYLQGIGFRGPPSFV